MLGTACFDAERDRLESALGLLAALVAEDTREREYALRRFGFQFPAFWQDRDVRHIGFKIDVTGQ